MPTRVSVAGRCSRYRDVLVVMAATVLGCPAGMQADLEAALLAPGQPVERRLEAGERHSFRVAPAFGRPARLLVEQRGVDVEIEVEVEGEADEEGTGFVVDAPFDRRGREEVLLSGRASYRIVVHGRERGAPSGTYRLRLEPLASGGAAADHRLHAVRAAMARARLYRQGTVPAWRQAAANYRSAADHWLAVGDDVEASRMLYALGVLQRLTEAPAEALVAIGEALERFRRGGAAAGDENGLEAYAANELGLDHQRLGDFDAASDAFSRAVTLGSTAGDDFIVAAATSNQCLIELARGELSAGRTCYRQAMPTIERARVAQIESAARINLGRLAEHLGEPEEALDHYRRALDLHSTSGNRRGQAQVLNNLGVLLRGLGRLDDAMERYADSLAIFETLGDQRWQARVINNIGYAYRSLDDTGRASASFERAGDLFGEIDDPRGEAAALDNLGLVRRQLGQTDDARAFHLRALELRRRIGHRQGEAVTLRRLGELQTMVGDTDAARGHLRAAISIAVEISDRLNEAASRLELGEVHRQRGELDDGQRQLEAALELAITTGQPAVEAEALVQLAQVERLAGRPDAARRRLDAALESLEKVRARLTSPDLRTSYSSLLRRAAELDVALLMAAHRDAPAAGHDRRALEAAERARARTFLELMQEADVDVGAGADAELAARRRRLVQRLDAKAERLGDPRLDAPSRATIAADQLVLLQRLEVLDGELRRASPAYAEIVRPRAMTVAEVQALVDVETVLAIYFLAEPISYLWRVTAAAVDTFELPGRRLIEAAARDVHRRWSELDAAARAEDHKAAEALTGMLGWSELAGARRLAVIADGGLHLIPFAALPALDRPGAAARPLIARAEVVSLPSAAALAFDRRLHSSGAVPRSVAILADPVFGPAHRDLPASSLEAAAISAAVDTVAGGQSLVALGVDANRELVESGRLRGYGVIHFATHGVIDTENPALSGLVLSQVGADGTPRRGYLRLHDIFELSLDAELVVLSGCRTALGPVVRGEGLIGLARGFHYAGARRVVASLWQVDDRATATLMAHFYRAMWQDALPPAAALAVAQRQLATTRGFRDPHHWGGFVLVGDWR